jgi:PKD repeat protein
MSWRKRVFGLVLLLTLVSSLPAVAAARPQQDPWAKVDARVRESLERQETTEFLVLLTAEANLSGAALLSTKEAKGEYVYRALKDVADRTQRDLRTYLDAQGVVYRAYYIRNMIWVRSADAAVALEIARQPEVDHIEANPWFHGISEPLPTFAEELPMAPEWNITKVRAPDVWALGYNGQGIVAAGNDTGIDWAHPALARHYRGCLNPPTCTSVDHNYNWHDAISNQQVPYDDYGHGTHTIGTVVGDDGGSNQIGMAPGARWIGCKNMDSFGTGSPATYIECFEYLLAPYPWNNPGGADPTKAPDVINNSWGCPASEGCSASTLEPAVQALRSAGVEVVVSAGNSGSSCSTVSDPPAIYQPSFTVGATDSSDNIASFSSRGPVTYGGSTYLKPEISAPGVSVRSCVPGTGYGNMSGTSMAGPHVAGEVALLLSACPALIGMPDRIEQIITSTAVARLSSQCGPAGPPNNVYGWGRIDALAAVQMAIAQCAGQGFLDGHVTDALTSSPIPGAVVTGVRAEGGSWMDTTDGSGYYTMTAPAGHYTVDAVQPFYTTGISNNVVVVTDTVTTVDFALQPRGRLWGYVTDADNGFGLAGAVVTADDGTFTTTDSAGYYALYLDGGTHAVTATMANYVPGTASVVMVAGQETRQDFSLWARVAVVPMPIHEYVLLNTTANTTAQILNRQATPYAFELYEIPGGYVPGPNAAWPGPDGFGYAGEMIDYQWVDIHTSGTPIPGLGDDSYAGPFNIGFPFPFYGTNQTQLYVSSNGFISFGSGSDEYNNDCPLPNSNVPNNILALMWGDLYPNYSTGGLYYQAFPTCPVGAGSCLVVEYYNWAHCCSPSNIAGTFEVVLMENGSVRMQFLDGGSEQGSGSTTGSEGNNAPSNHGLTYACNTADSIVDGLAMCYLYPNSSGCVAADVPWLGEAPLAGTVPAQGTFDVGIYFTATATVGVTQTGDYYATLVVNGSPKVRVPVTMTVIDYAVPPVAAFEASTPACDGVAVVFTDTSDLGLPPADQFLWAFGDGITATLENPTHLYAGPGSYEVSFELCNVAGCDTVTGTVAVLVAPDAAFTFAAEQLTVTFTNGSENATSYLWDFGDGTTATLENPVHTYAVAGTYAVTLTAYGCGEDDYTALVTVVGQPDAGFDATTPVCLGEPVVFTNTSTGADTYLWTLGDGATSTETNPVHLYAAVGTYAVSLTACSGAGCDSITGTVEILPLPAAGFTFLSNLLTVTFTNASQNATSYLWAFGDGITATVANPVHTYATVGTYTVTLRATGVCGTDEFVAVVPVSLLPMAGFLSNAPVCLGTPVVFTNTSINATSYLWTLGDGITSTLANPAHTYAAAGLYDVSLEACRGADCDTATGSVEVRPLPAAGFTFVTDLLTVTFTNGSANATTYQWAFGDGGTSTLPDPVHTYTAAGTYTVVLTATGVCGEDTVSYDVTASTTPPTWSIYLPLIMK